MVCYNILARFPDNNRYDDEVCVIKDFYGRTVLFPHHLFELIFIILTPWSNVHHLLGCSAEPQMDEEEHNTHEETDAAHYNVGNSQERVFPSQETGSRDDNAFCALELRHFKVVTDL